MEPAAVWMVHKDTPKNGVRGRLSLAESANCHPFIHGESLSSAAWPSRPRPVSWSRTSSSDQNTFVRLDSAPTFSPSVMRVTVRKVCHRYASASIAARTTASRRFGSAVSS